MTTPAIGRDRTTVNKTILLLSCLFSTIMPGLLHAGSYPDHPISTVVAYSPGGATDFQARIVTMMAGNKDYLGQPILIVNKPGEGGKVGWNWFAESASKDGYQLAAYNVPHFIAQSIMFDTRYNIQTLEPIANWGADPAVLLVSKNSPFNSVQDLIKYAKAHPGAVTVSGAGLYVGHHIAMLQLEKAAGIKLTYTPTKGGVPAMQKVLKGEVSAGFNNMSDSYRIRDRLKILAVADLERNGEFLPDVPTFKELGIDVDDSSVNFRGIMVPAGTPESVTKVLAKQIPVMLRDKKIAAKMSAGGAPMRVMTRKQVKAMWQRREVYLRQLLSELQRGNVTGLKK